MYNSDAILILQPTKGHVVGDLSEQCLGNALNLTWIEWNNKQPSCNTTMQGNLLDIVYIIYMLYSLVQNFLLGVNRGVCNYYHTDGFID